MKAILLSTAALVAVGCSSTQPQQTAQHSPSPQYQQTAYQQTQQPTSQQQAYHDSFIGERGPEGPAGSRGAQGQDGQTGPAGYAVAGPRGEAGPAGPAGPQGPAGVQGATGEMVRGPMGEVGPAGATGAQGQMGQTGVRGAGADGFAGPAGPAGPTGPVGPAGSSGERGQVLVGPAGPAGRAGPIGERGHVGQTGAAGSTTAGVAGAVGVAGPAGPQGAAGPMGPMGSTGQIANWTSYRDFWFDQNMTQMHEADRQLVSEIATYMQANPTIQLGIDASTNPRATAQRDVTMRDSRVNAIRSSLIAAGVPASRISAGQFGNVDHRRDGRVEILLRTDRQAQSPSSYVSSGSEAQYEVHYSVIENWTTLHSFWFNAGSNSIHSSDRDKVSEIASYIRRNPSLVLSIDSLLNANEAGLSSADHERASRRGSAVYEALIVAGVPEDNITSDTFGDASMRRDGRVTVFIKTDRLAQLR